MPDLEESEDPLGFGSTEVILTPEQEEELWERLLLTPLVGARIEFSCYGGDRLCTMAIIERIYRTDEGIFVDVHSAMIKNEADEHDPWESRPIKRILLSSNEPPQFSEGTTIILPVGAEILEAADGTRGFYDANGTSCEIGFIFT